MTGSPTDIPPVDPVVIPVSITIPNPLRERASGMSRLGRPGVLPANGWVRSPSVSPE
jgi:hypothetical protein